jgi:hypothetical protein
MRATHSPEQSHTSPNKTSDSSTEAPPALTVSVTGAVEAGCAASTASQRPSSAAAVVFAVVPSDSATVTAVSGAAQPKTCAGPSACSTMCEVKSLCSTRVLLAVKSLCSTRVLLAAEARPTTKARPTIKVLLRV